MVNTSSTAGKRVTGGRFVYGGSRSAGASGASIVQGALEGSNVNAISAAVGLVTLQRNMGLLQQALTAFHSEFNRIAAQELPRIT